MRPVDGELLRRRGEPIGEGFYRELAARLYVSPACAKRWCLVVAYAGRIDPWVDYLVRDELARMLWR